uniref:Uncharacterized protein n=1 Tax=Lactuca sativa TaxID=4236 RepID=A0A9R1UID2_LACSA|nr:hypothetical protein LSAT_V11C900463290 [Lactuca sativa]
MLMYFQIQGEELGVIASHTPHCFVFHLERIVATTVETKEIGHKIWEAMEETTMMVMVEIKTKILEMLVLNLVMLVTRMTRTLTMEVIMKMVGIRTTTVVICGIKSIEVETRTTKTTGMTKIYTMVATMIKMTDSGIKALEINTKGIQTVDSIM